VTHAGSGDPIFAGLRTNVCRREAPAPAPPTELPSTDPGTSSRGPSVCRGWHHPDPTEHAKPTVAPRSGGSRRLGGWPNPAEPRTPGTSSTT
jgi:hypothetical protein